MSPTQDLKEQAIRDMYATGEGRIIPNKPLQQTVLPSVKVALILKRELDIGTFDDTCTGEEITMIDDDIAHRLLHDAPVERNEA